MTRPGRIKESDINIDHILENPGKAKIPTQQSILTCQLLELVSFVTLDDMKYVAKFVLRMRPDQQYIFWKAAKLFKPELLESREYTLFTYKYKGIK